MVITAEEKERGDGRREHLVSLPVLASTTILSVVDSCGRQQTSPHLPCPHDTASRAYKALPK